MYQPITIADILKRPVFREAYLATGKSGLDRHVTWVHILDVPEARLMIRGGELVLSTGIGFVQRENGFYTFVHQLIEGGAVGLCIELGTAVTNVPEHVLQFAKSHSFPIIVFPTQVHFVDITQDIHSLILSRHHKLIDDLENLSRKLQQLTVNAMGTQQILQLVHETTGRPIFYGRLGHKPTIINNAPGRAAELLSEWTELLSLESDPMIEPKIIPIPNSFTQMRELGDVIVAQSAVVLGMSRGTFAIISNHNAVGDYLPLMVDRVTNALSLDEFRRLSIEERQLFGEQDWIERIIHNEAHDLPAFMESAKAQDNRYCVAVITYPKPTKQKPDEIEGIGSDIFDETDWLNTKAELSIATRLAFTKQGFRSYLSVRHDAIIAVLEWAPKILNVKSRIISAVQQLKKALMQSEIVSQIGVGVGYEVSMQRLFESYKVAVAACNIRTKAFDQEVLFYDESGIYRWVQLLERDERARDLATIDIHEIFEYDQKHHADLFQTLKIYLDCDRSKQKTAEQLYIHRQTLYHRLKLLNQLLQVDLEDPLQRLALHISVYFCLYERVQKGVK